MVSSGSLLGGALLFSGEMNGQLLDLEGSVVGVAAGAHRRRVGRGCCRLRRHGLSERFELCQETRIGHRTEIFDERGHSIECPDVVMAQTQSCERGVPGQKLILCICRRLRRGVRCNRLHGLRGSRILGCRTSYGLRWHEIGRNRERRKLGVWEQPCLLRFGLSRAVLCGLCEPIFGQGGCSVCGPGWNERWSRLRILVLPKQLIQKRCCEIFES